MEDNDPETPIEIWKGMDEEQKAECVGHLRDAVFHLASCWDALRELEGAFDTEIETDEISGMTGNVGADPAEAYQTIGEAELELLLDGGDEEDEDEEEEEDEDEEGREDDNG